MLKNFITLFRETFVSETNGLPGGWHVEQNSDMPQVPAFRKADHTIELLSAGNKYLPIIPDTTDVRVKMTFGIHYEDENDFGFYLCFRYNTFTGRDNTSGFTAKNWKIPS